MNSDVFVIWIDSDVCLKWWAQLERPRSSGGPSLDHAIRYCREHFLEPVTIKELADRTHLSREHFSREFQSRLGIPPGRFLRRKRRALRREDSCWRHPEFHRITGRI